jgi:hypothetical protein
LPAPVAVYRQVYSRPMRIESSFFSQLHKLEDQVEFSLLLAGSAAYLPGAWASTSTRNQLGKDDDDGLRREESHPAAAALIMQTLDDERYLLFCPLSSSLGCTPTPSRPAGADRKEGGEAWLRSLDSCG